MRLSKTEGEKLLRGEDLLALGKAADRTRQNIHPGDVVTFIIDRNINYSNICASECAFCAFYRKSGDRDAYLLTKREILNKVEETVRAGGTQIMMQGGLHPALDLAFYLDLLSSIKADYDIAIHSFSPAEILHMSKQSGRSVTDTLKALQAAGLDSLPGGGAEILVDRVRQRVSPKKISADDWLRVMESAHAIGMKSTATMVIGLGETLEERVEHMDKIRALQEKTGGFRAFITWTFQPGNTRLGGEKTSSWDYLRTLALTRLYLDNIRHIQGSWVTQGQQIGQLTLAFGANDLGSVMLEENVVRAAGTRNRMSVAKMIDTIQGAGKIAAQRDTQYRVIKTFGKGENNE